MARSGFCCRVLALAVFLSVGLWSTAAWAEPEPTVHGSPEDMAAFEKLNALTWAQAFVDPCTEDWTKRWFLDGEKAKLSNSDKGMDFHAGPKWREDAHHAVLWTKPSFAGDVKIEYEYTRLDEQIRAVTILYIQATGKGEGPYVTDIRKWSDRREVPSMSQYFKHMNTYHISYAAWGTRNDDPDQDYIRARRYRGHGKDRLHGTELKPDYDRTGLFETGVPHRITVIKRGKQLFMHIRNAEAEWLCHWDGSKFPAITEGRIGLRHMYTRAARYKDFRVSTLPGKQDQADDR